MGGSRGSGGQGRCERRSEVFVKIQKKNWGGGSGRGGFQVGCERDVGVKGDVGYGGCEPRIEGIVQYT